MNVIDKLYTEWAYRSKSGTPDIKNPEDKAILDSIINILVEEIDEETNEQNIIPEGDGGLDKHIIDRLNEIPKVHGSYSIPNSSTSFNVDPRDREAFSKIYKITVDQGMGNGEIALYWLFNHQEGGNTPASENRGKGIKDAADLDINGTKVEVKSYGTDGKIKLGKFAKDYKNLRILNTIFALDTLTKVFNPEIKKKVIIPTNFKTEELTDACKGVWKLKSIDLEELASVYDIFKDLRDNFNNLMRYTNDPNEPVEMAKMVITAICKRKFALKPGLDQFIVEVSPEGALDWFKVTEERLDPDSLLKYTAVSGGEITANYKKLFPK